MPRSLACPFFRTWRPDMGYLLGYWFADGNNNFLVGMSRAIQQEIGIPMPTCHLDKGSNTWAVKWYGVRAKCLAIWLYHNHAGLCLARKFALASAFAEWKPKTF